MEPRLPAPRGERVMRTRKDVIRPSTYRNRKMQAKRLISPRKFLSADTPWGSGEIHGETTHLGVFTVPLENERSWARRPWRTAELA